MYSCAHRQISTEDDAITPDSMYCVCRAVEPCSDHAYIHIYTAYGAGLMNLSSVLLYSIFIQLL